MTYSSLKSSLSYVELMTIDDIQDQTGLQKKDILFLLGAKEPKIPLFLASIYGRDKILILAEDAKVVFARGNEDYDNAKRDQAKEEPIPNQSTFTINSGAI